MTAIAHAHRKLTGKLAVALRPDQAFRLFTPRGEQDWVHDWRPHFPATPVDDTAPGTVFETHAHDQITTWVVVDRLWGRYIRYARVTPHVNAGTVTVTLDDLGRRSEITVTYELTALTDAASHELDTFARRYPAMLQSWSDALATALRSRDDQDL